MTWPEEDVMRILKRAYTGHDCRKWKKSIWLMNPIWILPAAVSGAIQTNRTSVFLSHVSGFILASLIYASFPIFLCAWITSAPVSLHVTWSFLTDLKTTRWPQNHFRSKPKSTSLTMAPCHREQPRRLCLPCENRATRCPCAVSAIHTQPWFTPSAKRPVSVKYLLPPGGRSGQMKCEAPGSWGRKRRRRRRWRRKRAAQT